MQCWCDNDFNDNDDGPQVVVNLVDMNDNLPVFDKEEYRVTIRENIAPGTKVVQVRHNTRFYDNLQYTCQWDDDDDDGDGDDDFDEYDDEYDDDSVDGAFQALSVSRSDKIFMLGDTQSVAK